MIGIFYQIMNINQTSVAGLLKKDNIISSRKISEFLGFSLPNIIYVDLFFIGIIILSIFYTSIILTNLKLLSI